MSSHDDFDDLIVIDDRDEDHEDHDGNYVWHPHNDLVARSSALDLSDMARAILASPHHLQLPVTATWDNCLRVPPPIGQRLQVRHDEDNWKDRFACALWWGEHWVGYLPAASARTLAPFIDQGEPIHIHVLRPGGSKAWSMLVSVAGGPAVQALLDARLEAQAAEAASEIALWRQTLWGKCGYRETEAHQKEVLQRCSIRALDLFVAFMPECLPEFRLNDKDRYWMAPVFEANRVKVDQDLDDLIPF